MKKFYYQFSLSCGLICVVLFLCSNANAQTITTVAGRAGYLGDGGQAVNGILSNPYAIAADASGNVYVACSGDGHVRKIDASSKLLSTYAGNTGAIYYGDGGLATDAYFNLTKGAALAFDKNGNMYVADCANNRIRKITASTGVITTIAGTGTSGYSGDGGLATAAKISGGEGIAIDANGNIYFSDKGNNVIRKITASSGDISTVAGIVNNSGYTGDNGAATSAAIGVIERIAFDATGNLYLADTKNNVVRKIDVATQVVTTVAGTGTAGYTGDGGQATAASLQGVMGITFDGNNNLYITDRADGVIREVDASTKVITTVAGTGTNGYAGDGGAATSAQLDSVTDVLVDAQGNIYVDDLGNNRIRQINGANHIITTIAGVGFARPQENINALSSNFYFPGALAFDAAGNLYTGDFYKIRKVDMTTNVISAVAGGGLDTTMGVTATNYDIQYVHAITIDRNGNLYFTNEPLNKVLVVNTTSQKVTVFAGNGNTDGSGNNGPATQAAIRPMNLATDSSNNIFISDINSFIWKVNAQTGIIIKYAGSDVQGFSGDGGAATSARLSSQGKGMAVDKQGNLYIADAYNFRVRRVDAQTKIITTIAGDGTEGFSGDGGVATSAELSIVSAITIDANGNIFITDGNRVRKISAGTNIISTIAGGDAAGYSGDNGAANLSSLNAPYDLKLSPNGDLYVADFGNHVIRRISQLSLPLNYLSFTGAVQKDGVNLTWQTGDEINTSYFNVTRSVDGVNFTVIGKVDAKNSENVNNYTFLDEAGLLTGNPVVYYRLKELDKDGAVNYSKIISIKTNETPFNITVSPNPVADNIKIYSSVNATNAVITLVSATGQLLRAISQPLVAGQQVTINAANLAKGIYFVTVKAAGTQLQVKVVK